MKLQKEEEFDGNDNVFNFLNSIDAVIDEAEDISSKIEYALDEELDVDTFITFDATTGESFNFNYDSLTGLGAILLDTNNNGLVDKIEIHLDRNFEENDTDIGLQLIGDDSFLISGLLAKSSPSFNLDIDGNGEVKALEDGIIAIRYMFGNFEGDSLIDGAIAPDATRSLEEIRDYLQQGMDDLSLDIDGNGEVKALEDGIMAIRYMFGNFEGNTLIDGAIASDATHDLTQIQSNLEQLTTII